MQDQQKVMTAREAVQRFIKPGTHIAFGGVTVGRKPMTIAREIVRQGVGELYVTANFSSWVEEMLAGAGLIKKFETTYFGLEAGMPVAYAIRRAVETGEIELLEDYSNLSFAMRALAARMGWPFAPCMGDLGSDLPEFDVFGRAGLRGKDANGDWIHPGIPPKKLQVIDDPFEGWGLRPRKFRTGEDTCANQTNAYRQLGPKATAYTGKQGVKVALVPPLLPEVVVIRAQKASVEGTVRVEGVVGSDIDQAVSGRILIVECERVCSAEELRFLPEHNQIPGFFVHAVVEQPFGAHPTSVPSYYDYDYHWLRRYVQTCNHQSLDFIKRFWREEVGDTENDWDYFTRKIGWSHLLNLVADPVYRYNPEYDRFGEMEGGEKRD
ncbi:MAG: hypothetical protein HPY50_05140 [Firmicutes bacterium]|nr:hypothetical protein [Bacillota bacterium]